VMTTSEITRWFRDWREAHPDGRFTDGLEALLDEHPDAGGHAVGTVAECFALAAPGVAPEVPSVRHRRYAQAARFREKEARRARINEDRASRGLPPWENWRDEFYDPYAMWVLWFLLALVLSIIGLPRGVDFGWIAAGSVAATGLVTWVVRRTDPREKQGD
jgi:hypothetical protein